MSIRVDKDEKRRIKDLRDSRTGLIDYRVATLQLSVFAELEELASVHTTVSELSVKNSQFSHLGTRGAPLVPKPKKRELADIVVVPEAAQESRTITLEAGPLDQRALERNTVKNMSEKEKLLSQPNLETRTISRARSSQPVSQST